MRPTPAMHELELHTLLTHLLFGTLCTALAHIILVPRGSILLVFTIPILRFLQVSTNASSSASFVDTGFAVLLGLNRQRFAFQRRVELELGELADGTPWTSFFFVMSALAVLTIGIIVDLMAGCFAGDMTGLYYTGSRVLVGAYAWQVGALGHFLVRGWLRCHQEEERLRRVFGLDR